VALDVEDLEWTGDGWLKIYVRRSKTDQEGAGMTKAVPCGSESGDVPAPDASHVARGLRHCERRDLPRRAPRPRRPPAQ